MLVAVRGSRCLLICVDVCRLLCVGGCALFVVCCLLHVVSYVVRCCALFVVSLPGV